MLLLEPVVLPAPLRNTWKSRFLPDRLYQYYQHQVRWVETNLPGWVWVWMWVWVWVWVWMGCGCGYVCMYGWR